MRPSWLLWGGIAVMWFLILTEMSNASTTATVTHGAVPSQADVTVRIDLKAKRHLERKVFTQACWEPGGVLACVGPYKTKRVHLRPGKNRLTIALSVRALWYGVPYIDPLRGPVDPGFVAAPSADTVFYSFGQDRTMKEARPVGQAASREVLVDGR